MRESLPIALVLVLAAILLAGCQALYNPGPTPPPAGKPLIVPGIPGLYLAWGSVANAVPPTREPGDPLAPGNEILGMRTPTAAATAVPTATATRAPSATPVPTASPTATSRPAEQAMPESTATAIPTATVTAVPSSMPSSGCSPRPLGSLALNGPRALAAGPNGFYAALFETSELVGFTGDTRIRTWQRQSGPGRTNGLAAWGDTLTATNRDAGTATLHRPATGEQLAIIPVGSLPWGVGAGAGPSGTGAAYVVNFGDNSVSVIDLATRRRLTTTAVGEAPVTALVAGEEVYVLHLGGVLTRLDAAGKMLGQSSTGLRDTRGIGHDPLRKRLYAGSESGAIVALSLPALTPIRTYTLPGPAYAVTVNQGTGRVFAVDAQGDRLFAIDPDSGAIDVLPLPDQGDSQGGQGLVAQANRIAVSNFASNSVSFFDDATCADRLTPVSGSAGGATRTPSATPTRTPAATFTAMPSRTPTSRPSVTPVASHTPTPTATRTAPPATATWTPTPIDVRAKVEIVWPHGGAGVDEADLANITAYLLAGDGTQGARTLLDSVPCDWEPTVKLWRALNNQPARLVSVGEKRMVTGGARNFPAWDFNDVDVRDVRDPSNKLSFYVTVEGTGAAVDALHNVWVHAVDARTLFPQQDVPTSVTKVRPSALDAKIQIVWPHDSLPVQEAQKANITAYLFTVGTQQALSPDITAATGWSPTVRLHASLNNEPEAAPGTGVTGVPRVVTGANGIRFLAWDFNDVDVSLANEALNRLYFWVTVDGVPTFSNIWAHGADARTLFPQPDVLNSCR